MPLRCSGHLSYLSRFAAVDWSAICGWTRLSHAGDALMKLPWCGRSVTSAERFILLSSSALIACVCMSPVSSTRWSAAWSERTMEVSFFVSMCVLVGGQRILAVVWPKDHVASRCASSMGMSRCVSWLIRNAVADRGLSFASFIVYCVVMTRLTLKSSTSSIEPLKWSMSACEMISVSILSMPSESSVGRMAFRSMLAREAEPQSNSRVLPQLWAT